MKKIHIQYLKDNLPQYPNIMGKNEFFNAAVLVPLVQKNDEYHFLFEERSLDIRQGGEICFPGGFRQKEIDKTYEQTAIRETIEELGIKKSQIQIIGRMDTLLAPMGMTVDPFIGILDIDDISKINIDNDEVARVFLLPVSYFETQAPEKYQIKLMAHPTDEKPDGQTEILFPVHELGLPKRYHQPWGGSRLNVYVYRTPEAMIWGLTAKIIYNFIQKIEPS
ncbi:DNA mismatch repair protein MutT [Candidatus Magnetomorum sp. HK-1]|nr:DNA mismatch repair protein MutT [Candidatus Magnetomorum sp. HK-1]